MSTTTQSIVQGVSTAPTYPTAYYTVDGDYLMNCALTKTLFITKGSGIYQFQAIDYYYAVPVVPSAQSWNMSQMPRVWVVAFSNEDTMTTYQVFNNGTFPRVFHTIDCAQFDCQQAINTVLAAQAFYQNITNFTSSSSLLPIDSLSIMRNVDPSSMISLMRASAVDTIVPVVPILLPIYWLVIYHWFYSVKFCDTLSK